MYAALLACHVTGGAAALLAAAAALATTKGERAHVFAGRVFGVGMTVVFATAVPMTILRPNTFLLLIAVFSFYLVATGWLRARNRSGTPRVAEWIAVVAMGIAAIAMLGHAVALLRAGDTMGVVLLTFGVIGGGFTLGDVYALSGRRYRGTPRIAAHLTRMLAGTIAALTAFTVVNVHVQPAWMVWLAPTVVITPVIVYWNLRVLRAPRGW